MSALCAGDVFIKPSYPEGAKSEIISLEKVGWTASGSRIRSKQDPNLPGIEIYIRRGRSLGTDLGRSMQMQAVTCRNIERDTFLDDEVGDTIRYIKRNFGSDPLLEAYEAALDTFKELDKRWKEYLEEEARRQSIFEGED